MQSLFIHTWQTKLPTLMPMPGSQPYPTIHRGVSTATSFRFCAYVFVVAWKFFAFIQRAHQSQNVSTTNHFGLRFLFPLSLSLLLSLLDRRVSLQKGENGQVIDVMSTRSTGKKKCANTVVIPQSCLGSKCFRQMGLSWYKPSCSDCSCKREEPVCRPQSASMIWHSLPAAMDAAPAEKQDQEHVKGSQVKGSQNVPAVQVQASEVTL